MTPARIRRVSSARASLRSPLCGWPLARAAAERGASMPLARAALDAGRIGSRHAPMFDALDVLAAESAR